jgi:hypothetical protein
VHSGWLTISTPVSLANYSTDCPTLINHNPRWSNRSNSGRRTKWTQVYPAPRKLKKKCGQCSERGSKIRSCKSEDLWCRVKETRRDHHHRPSSCHSNSSGMCPSGCRQEVLKRSSSATKHSLVRRDRFVWYKDTSNGRVSTGRFIAADSFWINWLLRIKFLLCHCTEEWNTFFEGGGGNFKLNF